MKHTLELPNPPLPPELYRERFARGWIFPAYLELVEKNQELWRGLYEKAELSAEVVREVQELDCRWRLLVLSEDWCGDAVNSLAWIARLAEASEELELRVLSREDNPEIMDAHRWEGRSRSIPVVILLDEGFHEVAWWGPRPRELQAWATGEGRVLDPRARYREIRRWYARDRGRSVVREVLDLIPSGAPCGSWPAWTTGHEARILAP